MQEIRERELQLPFPIPEPVRRLNEWFTPERWQVVKSGEARLLDLSAAIWCTYYDVEIKGPKESPSPIDLPAKSWKSGAYFGFGGFGYGDLLMYAANPPSPPVGKVIIMGGGEMERRRE